MGDIESAPTPGQLEADVDGSSQFIRRYRKTLIAHNMMESKGIYDYKDAKIKSCLIGSPSSAILLAYISPQEGSTDSSSFSRRMKT
jgi:hypothetical protein